MFWYVKQKLCPGLVLLYKVLQEDLITTQKLSILSKSDYQQRAFSKISIMHIENVRSIEYLDKWIKTGSPSFSAGPCLTALLNSCLHSHQCTALLTKPCKTLSHSKQQTWQNCVGKSQWLVTKEDMADRSKICDFSSNATQHCNASFQGSVSRTGKDPACRRLNYLLLLGGGQLNVTLPGHCSKHWTLTANTLNVLWKNKGKYLGLLIRHLSWTLNSHKKIKRGKVTNPV